MTDFIAKNNYYGDPLPENDNQSLDKRITTKKSMIDEFIKDTDIIDLSNRNIGNLHDLLQSSIIMNFPTSPKRRN